MLTKIHKGLLYLVQFLGKQVQIVINKIFIVLPSLLKRILILIMKPLTKL